MGADGYYEALWPRSPRQIRVKPLAKRLDTLAGKTVAQVWDHVFRGDEVFEFLEAGLKARFPGVRFVSGREFGKTDARLEFLSRNFWKTETGPFLLMPFAHARYVTRVRFRPLCKGPSYAKLRIVRSPVHCTEGNRRRSRAFHNYSVLGNCSSDHHALQVIRLVGI